MMAELGLSGTMNRAEVNNGFMHPLNFCVQKTSEERGIDDDCLTRRPEFKNCHIPKVKVLATEYASYREGVIDALALQLKDAAQRKTQPLVLYDPMAGTAPLLCFAERQGYTAFFNDLNSLHFYVNAAKTFRSFRAFRDIGPSKMLSIVCRMVPKLDRCSRTPTEDWIEKSVLEKLMSAWKKSEQQRESLSVLTKAILLLAVRDFSSYVKTKNPTWLKPGGLRPDISAEQAFRSAIERLRVFYEAAYAEHLDIKVGHIHFTDNDSSRKVPRCKVDVVMTSPPFCNRVDWDRMYAPEHFFLNAVGVWHTRTEFLGTTAVRLYPEFESDFKYVTERSSYLREFLTQVRKRQIRSELLSDYYVKYFTRYFAGLFRVFDNAADALGKGNAGIYIVVQDNVHRGLLIEIGQALKDSLSSRGFQTSPLPQSWERHHLGLQNISKHYRLVTPKQRETIWHAAQ